MKLPWNSRKRGQTVCPVVRESSNGCVFTHIPRHTSSPAIIVRSIAPKDNLRRFVTKRKHGSVFWPKGQFVPIRHDRYQTYRNYRIVVDISNKRVRRQRRRDRFITDRCVIHTIPGTSPGHRAMPIGDSLSGPNPVAVSHLNLRGIFCECRMRRTVCPHL